MSVKWLNVVVAALGPLTNVAAHELDAEGKRRSASLLRLLAAAEQEAAALLASWSSDAPAALSPPVATPVVPANSDPAARMPLDSDPHAT